MTTNKRLERFINENLNQYFLMIDVEEKSIFMIDRIKNLPGIMPSIKEGYAVEHYVFDRVNAVYQIFLKKL